MVDFKHEGLKLTIQQLYRDRDARDEKINALKEARLRDARREKQLLEKIEELKAELKAVKDEYSEFANQFNCLF